MELEAARDSIEPCDNDENYPCRVHVYAERAESMAVSTSNSFVTDSQPSFSSTQTLALSSEAHSSLPTFSPTSECFQQALTDPTKEAMVINYLQSKYQLAFNMIKQVSVSMQLGMPLSDYEFIRVLMHAAAQNPTAFNFECRELETHPN